MDVLSEEEKGCITEISKNAGFLGDIRIEVSNFSKPGDNYLGALLGIEVIGEDDKRTPKRLSLILKKVCIDREVDESLSLSSAFVREVDFYSVVAPAFRDIQRMHNRSSEDLLSFIPKCYKTKCEGGSGFIILEDLRASSFCMKDRKAGMSYDECMLAMQSLGILHAFSYAMKQHCPSIFHDLSSRFMDNPLVKPELRQKRDQQLQQLVDITEHGVRQVSAEAAERLKPFLSDGFCSLMREFSLMRDQFSVLVHGDSWTNNIFFRGNPPTDIRLLDYQIMVYTSPVLDVMYTLNTSVSIVLRKAHFEDFLSRYHSSLIDSLRKLRTDYSAFTMQSLKNQIKKFSLKTLGSALIAIPIVRGGEYEEEKNITTRDTMEKISLRHSCCMKDKEIQRMVVDIINDYIDRRFID